MLRIITRPNIGRSDGRIVVMKGQKVILGKHYRNPEHKELIVKEIKETVQIFGWG